MTTPTKPGQLCRITWGPDLGKIVKVKDFDDCTAHHPAVTVEWERRLFFEFLDRLEVIEK